MPRLQTIHILPKKIRTLLLFSLPPAKRATVDTTGSIPCSKKVLRNGMYVWKRCHVSHVGFAPYSVRATAARHERPRIACHPYSSRSAALHCFVEASIHFTSLRKNHLRVERSSTSYLSSHFHSVTVPIQIQIWPNKKEYSPASTVACCRPSSTPICSLVSLESS